MIPEELEISMGESQYLHQRQIFQGDYVADPDLVTYVEKVGYEIAKVSDRVLPYEFAVVNSSELNAWALPGGKIALTRGLLVNIQNEPELAAVLAHEIVHAAASHGTRNQSLKIALRIINLGASLLIHDQQSLKWVNEAIYIGGRLSLLNYSRLQELEADFYGMNYMDRAGFDPEGMITLQETLKALYHKDENGLKTLFSTHPQFDERLSKAKLHLAAFSSKSYPNHCERFQKALKYLQGKREAYKYYDKAVSSVKNDEIEKAWRLLDKAISIEPKEALFYALRGQILLKKHHEQGALADLNRAIDLNPDFWQQYMSRAIVYESLGKPKLAFLDYQKSVNLLPTVEAYYSLGRIAAAEGNDQEAVAYLKKAWQPASPVKEEAGKLLAELDLEKNPKDYFHCRIGRDDQKNIVIEITNITPLPAMVLEVKLQKHHKQGWKKKRVFKMEEILEPGQTLIFYTDSGPIKDRKIYKYRAKVTGASLID